MEMHAMQGQPAPSFAPAGSLRDVPDASLLELATTGDSDAFGEIVRRYERLVRKRCLHYLENESDIEDVMQTVLTKFYRHLPEFEPRCQLSTWLYRITSNACIDHLRHHKRKHSMVVSMYGSAQDGADELGPLEFSDERHHPEAGYLTDELRGALRGAIEALPASRREAFLLREMEGLKYDEIARRLGCSLGAVKSRIFYARESLKQTLATYLD